MSIEQKIETVIIQCPEKGKIVIPSHTYAQRIAIDIAFLLYQKKFIYTEVNQNGILGKNQIISKQDGRFQNKEFIVRIKKHKLQKKPTQTEKKNAEIYYPTVLKIKAMISHATQNDIYMKMIIF
jgi:hypothetical protein